MEGVQISLEGIRKGYLFCPKWYIKGEGFGPQGGASKYKTLMSAPPGSWHHGVLWFIVSCNLLRRCALFETFSKLKLRLDLGQNTLTLNKITDCRRMEDNDEQNSVRKLWYFIFSHSDHLSNTSWIFFTYSNFGGGYLWCWPKLLGHYKHILHENVKLYSPLSPLRNVEHVLYRLWTSTLLLRGCRGKPCNVDILHVSVNYWWFSNCRLKIAQFSEVSLNQLARIVDNQSEYRKSLTQYCWLMPCEYNIVQLFHSWRSIWYVINSTEQPSVFFFIFTGSWHFIKAKVAKLVLFIENYILF